MRLASLLLAAVLPRAAPIPDEVTFRTAMPPAGLQRTVTSWTLLQTTIEIQTTVQHLPSLEFRWVAFVHWESILTRLPQVPDYGHWLTHEKGVY